MADEDFFIGWATPSRSTLGFLGGVVAALLVLFAGTAVAVAQFQASPGPSERKTATYVGLYRSQPYGHLVVPGEAGPETILLSTGSKFGLQGKFTDKDETVVEATGFGMTRDGRSFLEIWNMKAAELAPEVVETLRGTDWEALGEVTLSGEIVDSKCYYGRMRPGSGKAHRACAQLCIRGGIPPVLVTRTPEGQRSHVVLAGPGQSDIHESILPYVAEPVRVTGALARQGDLFVLDVDLDSGIERLWPALR